MTMLQPNITGEPNWQLAREIIGQLRVMPATSYNHRIGERDIMRAMDPARLLEKLTGHPTRAVVSGYSISPYLSQLA